MSAVAAASVRAVRALERGLRQAVDGDIRFDPAGRALFASGGSNYRQVPIGIVAPRTADAAVAAVAVCAEHDVPVLPLGADTSLAGQSTNVAVVVDFARHLDSILEIDPQRARARVQPGVILDHLKAAAEPYGLTFGPDPSTHAYCTLGGMIGNNSCGTHSVMAGRTSANVETLDILTYDGLRLTVGPTSEAELDAIVAAGGRRGDIYRAMRDLRDRYAALIRERFPDIPRRVSGYSLDELLPERGFNVARALVGTEGTCVTVLEAEVRLVPDPPARALVVLGYPDIYEAAADVTEVLDFHPIALEGIDEVLVSDMRAKGMHPDDVGLLPPGRGWLLVEFGAATKAEADEQGHRMIDAVGKRAEARLFDEQPDEVKIWELRESGLGATAFVPGQAPTHEGWEDAAVPPARLADYLREFRALLDRYGYHGAFYGHFGQGCVHTRTDYELRTASGIRKFRSFIHDAADLVVAYGGSLSGEHGDGQSRAELLPKMFGPELVGAFAEFKAIWDPRARMNPHKVVDPHRVDQDLRLGTSYRPMTVATHFDFPDDNGSFADASRRCVGVGKCRRTEGGTMCPSFMVTRDEQHSTRGRAHLLFEMLQGDVVAGGWRDQGVKQALDLCLACKGCKAECPVNVDLATYKAEFLSHFYRRRLRPRAAYSMGLIHWLARAASHAPRVANAMAHARVASRLLKRAGGVAPAREIPRFADESFRRSFARRAATRDGAPVLLFIDTFVDNFAPQIGHAAVAVLEAAGYGVETPREVLCCGRPLYDYGMLTLAKRKLRQILGALRSAIADGTPIVVLEPSCAAVFRDELINLFPHDADARRLAAQTVTLGELLRREPQPLPPLRLDRDALVQPHCHHHAVLEFADDEKLLRSIGLDVKVIDGGCCGMAGSFGFEAGDRYEVSRKAGERVVLPAVRAASPETILVADGFSCREQILQGTGRQALHTAEVLQLALAETAGRTTNNARV